MQAMILRNCVRLETKNLDLVEPSFLEKAGGDFRAPLALLLDKPQLLRGHFWAIWQGW
jgi:hypothetical protein